MSSLKLARLADLPAPLSVACRQAGVANNTIIKIEAGKNQNPTLDTLKKIAKALNVPIEDLIK